MLGKETKCNKVEKWKIQNTEKDEKTNYKEREKQSIYKEKGNSTRKEENI